ncbi:hypothetical protein [Streptomyces decoyicus]|uniref:hypothetical protein n=1 Tax=Streptomyces decoyicus TaxID=249567 RepID=UPI00380E7E82
MTRRTIVEAHVYGADEEITDLFTTELPGIQVTRPTVTRSIGAQVLELSGDAASIVAVLLTIKATLWPPRPPVPPRSVTIVLRNLAGDSIELQDASEEELRAAIDPPPDTPE